MAEPCGTIEQALETIHTAEEMEAFSDTLKNPPKGAQVKPVTAEEWQAIAQKKIQIALRDNRA